MKNFKTLFTPKISKAFCFIAEECPPRFVAVEALIWLCWSLWWQRLGVRIVKWIIIITSIITIVIYYLTVISSICARYFPWSMVLYLKQKFWEPLLHLHRNHSLHQWNCYKNFLLHHCMSSLQKRHQLRLVLIEFSFFSWNYMKHCSDFRPFCSTAMFTISKTM